MKSSTFTTSVIAIFVLALAALASASTVQAGTCAINDAEQQISAHFATIQAAVNAASPGSTVLVCPGTYTEQIEITKALTLRGVPSGNMAAAVVAAPSGGLVVPPGGITVSAPQVFVHDTGGPVFVSNLTIDGSNIQVPSCATQVFVIGLYFLNAPGRIENIVARNQIASVDGVPCFEGIAIRATADTTPTEVTVDNNSVSGFDYAGILATLPSATVNIRHNSFVGTPGSAGIVPFFNVLGEISENFVTDNTSAGIGIAVVGVQNAVISHNHLSNNSYGIAFYTFTGDPNSDYGIVADNEVFGSDTDAIAICGSSNVVKDNTISGSTESGVNITTGAAFGIECSANNNVIRNNTINGACAGVLIDPTTSGTSIDENLMFNVTNIQLIGNSCPLPVAANLAVAVRNTESIGARIAHRAAQMAKE